MTAGPPKSSPQCGCLGPVGDELGRQGTRAWMTSSSTIHASAGYSWIAILINKLRLGLRFRLRPPDIDDVRNPLIAHAAIGSPGRARLFQEARAMKRILLVFGIVVLMIGA